MTLKYEPDPTKPAPITGAQILPPRRIDDDKPGLWITSNRVQEENLVRGGLPESTRRQRTRAVEGIDHNVKMNRAFWMLAEEMRRLNA